MLHDLIVAAIPVALGVLGLAVRRAAGLWRTGQTYERIQRTVAEIVLGYDDDHSIPPQHVDGLGDRITALSRTVEALSAGQDVIARKSDEVLFAVRGPHGIAHRAERAVTTALFVALTMNQVAAREGKPEPFDLDDLLSSRTAPERLSEIARGVMPPPAL